MAAKLKSSTWADFSDRVVAMCQLPEGSGLRLYKRNGSRRVRSDFTVKRKHVTTGSFDALENTDTVSDLLDQAKALLSTDVDARGLELKFYGPDGSRIYGNTHLGTVRRDWPTPSSEDSKSFKSFCAIMETNGFGDAPSRQVGKLLADITEIAGPDFVKRLSAWAA